MKDGWYRGENGEIIAQKMQHATGIQKGIRAILKERGNRHISSQGHELKLLCGFCKRKASDEEREEGIEGGWDSDQCCQKRVLDMQEDFLAQREWLK